MTALPEVFRDGIIPDIEKSNHPNERSDQADNRSAQRSRTMDRRLKIQKVLDDVVNTLISEYHPERILLFGSFVSGEADEISDIDLLIVKESQESPYRRAVRVRRLLRDPKRRTPIDLLVVTPQELAQRLEIGDQFVQEILSKGKVLYAR